MLLEEGACMPLHIWIREKLLEFCAQLLKFHIWKKYELLLHIQTDIPKEYLEGELEQAVIGWMPLLLQNQQLQNTE